MNDGLYWSTELENELGTSPIRAAVPRRTTYLRPDVADDAYHGYHFHVLATRGRSASGRSYGVAMEPGGAGGFAIVAYPVQHARTGLMTFVVRYDGRVFEKNLGSQSAEIAAELTTLDAGSGWAEVKLQ